MIVKDTPRNLEFLSGNAKSLTPMSREEAIISGTNLDPLSGNEQRLMNVVGGGTTISYITATISVADTSDYGAYIYVPCYYKYDDIDNYVFTLYSMTKGFESEELQYPMFGTEPTIIEIIADSGSIDSVNGSGFTMLESDYDPVRVCRLMFTSETPVIRVKLTTGAY